MYVGVFDIVQYDCPVVWLTERVKDSSILVIGANVAEIRKGYEKIYVVVIGDDVTVNQVLTRIESIKSIKRYEVLQKKRKYLKMNMVINKTNAMEATVNHDATPLTTWVALDGFERWTLGFHKAQHLRGFMEKVSEYDYIEKYRAVELPEHVLAVDYFSLLSLIDESISRLTNKQAELLATAVKLGYFEWPRKISISSLAKELGISRVAAAKTLRRAEKNAIGMFLSMLEKRSAVGSKARLCGLRTKSMLINEEVNTGNLNNV